jgi:hypothetical protein
MRKFQDIRRSSETAMSCDNWNGIVLLFIFIFSKILEHCQEFYYTPINGTFIDFKKAFGIMYLVTNAAHFCLGLN